jgi:DNA-binding transcriptional ArsR family regulator
MVPENRPACAGTGYAADDIVNVMVNSPALDRRFEALSHPVRRRIVERLARGPATVGEAAAGIPVSKPAISRHLRVLEEADVIVRVVDGRRHRLALNGPPLADAAAWIEHQRKVWERKFDVVEEYLNEQEER